MEGRFPVLRGVGGRRSAFIGSMRNKKNRERARAESSARAVSLNRFISEEGRCDQKPKPPWLAATMQASIGSESQALVRLKINAVFLDFANASPSSAPAMIFF